MTCVHCGHPTHEAWRCHVQTGRDPIDLCECPFSERHAVGPLTVRLSAEDEAWADQVAEARTNNAQERGWKPILNMDTRRGDRIGARAELAVALAYGAEWRDPFRLDPERNHDPDVANVDVRGVASPRGGMPIRPRDRDDRAQVMVIVPGEGDCIIVGWCFGYDAKRDEFWREADDNGPGYWSVPQSRLFDPAWLSIERLP